MVWIRTLTKLLLLTLALNLVRYFVGGAIEAITIMTPMHAVMPLFGETFDFTISLAYNFMLWFAAVLQFHLMRPALRGPIVVRSLISFGVSWLAFASLAAVYMNHYVDAVKPFYAWSIVDAAILFPLVALANALLYPLLFRTPKPN